MGNIHTLMLLIYIYIRSDQIRSDRNHDIKSLYTHDTGTNPSAMRLHPFVSAYNKMYVCVLICRFDNKKLCGSSYHFTRTIKFSVRVFVS